MTKEELRKQIDNIKLPKVTVYSNAAAPRIKDLVDTSLAEQILALLDTYCEQREVEALQAVEVANKSVDLMYRYEDGSEVSIYVRLAQLNHHQPNSPEDK